MNLSVFLFCKSVLASLFLKLSIIKQVRQIDDLTYLTNGKKSSNKASFELTKTLFFEAIAIFTESIRITKRPPFIFGKLA
ncbi:MAG: hypothetical protein EAZ42_05420 [Verrucomicrobia bacterium]|nr:MAG: hypothetical protein EAZ42_05420 [Verrucomicrobiota bacterium]